MKQLSTGLCTLVFLFLISSLRPVQAQMTADATRAAGRFSYDGTEEITVTGTVSSVLAKAAPGMIAGSYLLPTRVLRARAILIFLMPRWLRP